MSDIGTLDALSTHVVLTDGAALVNARMTWCASCSASSVPSTPQSCGVMRSSLCMWCMCINHCQCMWHHAGLPRRMQVGKDCGLGVADRGA